MGYYHKKSGVYLDDEQSWLCFKICLYIILGFIGLIVLALIIYFSIIYWYIAIPIYILLGYIIYRFRKKIIKLFKNEMKNEKTTKKEKKSDLQIQIESNERYKNWVRNNKRKSETKLKCPYCGEMRKSEKAPCLFCGYTKPEEEESEEDLSVDYYGRNKRK